MTITKGSTPAPTAPTNSNAQNQALQQFLAGLGNSSSSSSGTGLVFMGMAGGLANKNTSELSEAAQAQLAQRGTPKWWTEQDAENQYFNWTQKQRDDFRAKGLLSGLLTAGAGDLEAFNLWQNLVKQASLYGAQKQQVGPLDILAGYVKGNSSGGWIKSADGQFETNPITGERRYIGPQFKTTTQTQVNLTDPATAKAIATSVFQQLLGRDPGQGEISAYANALSQAEQQSPSSTTTITQYDPTTGEAIGTNSVSSGGVTSEAQQQMAEDQIKKGKEYGAKQAATTYMNALLSAVGGQ